MRCRVCDVADPRHQIQNFLVSALTGGTANGTVSAPGALGTGTPGVSPSSGPLVPVLGASANSSPGFYPTSTLAFASHAGLSHGLRDMMLAAMFFGGYYQPAGPLIHAGSELCRAASSKLGGPAGPSLLLPPEHVEQQAHQQQPPTSSGLQPPPPPPPHIVSSQGSPFRHYTTAYQYAPPPPPPPQYHPAQYFHPAPQSALVATSHLPPQELCPYPCYPHYKYAPHAAHSPYRRYPPPTFYSPQPDPYSLPGPSTSSSSFQPPTSSSAPPISSSAGPSGQQQQQQHQQQQQESNHPPPSNPGPAFPPPAPQLSQQPPEPAPAYQYYPGYSPGTTACYSHGPPPPPARGVPYIDAAYQACPCPMQSCPKNVHTGPLTGDSKGPGPQETLFVLPPVAAAAAAHPSSGGPLPPGHPPSPARGSSGGPPAAQGPSPPTTAADQAHQQRQSPEAPAWVAAEPTPPPSDDSSAPRGGDTDLCDSESTTDVNQNYRGSSKKRRLSISSRLDNKKMKTDAQFSPILDSSAVFSALNEPLLITTTMLQANKKALDEAVILREEFDIKNNNVQMPNLPPTPPTSTDTSPPPKPKKEKRPRAKVVKRKAKSKGMAATPELPKTKQQKPRKRNTSMLKSHGIRDSLPQLPSALEISTEPEVVKPKAKSSPNGARAKPPASGKASSKSSPSKVVAACDAKPLLSSSSGKPAKLSPHAKARGKSKLVPSATEETSLPGLSVTPAVEQEPAADFALPQKLTAPAKKGGKRRSSPAHGVSAKKSKKMSAAAALAAAREAEESEQNDLLKKTILRKTVVPKWSNGWSWEGEPFQAKVFLKNDDTSVLRLCYPAMRHEEGDLVKARDCILLKSGTRKGDLPFVAKVAALWENPEDGEMMLSLLWYYRPEHTDKGRKPEDMPDEIFASKHKDHSSVACIEDKCYVLTFNEYCRYRGSVRQVEEGFVPRPSVVPALPAELASSREHRLPMGRVAPDLVFFCRKVYDFRQKRMLKNPG